MILCAQIEIGEQVSGNLTRAMTYTTVGMPFYFEALNWEVGGVFFFEVYLKATAGLIFARVVNETDTLEVMGSEVETSSGTMVRLRSQGFELQQGKTYRPQVGQISGSGATGEIVSAKLVRV